MAEPVEATGNAAKQHQGLAVEQIGQKGAQSQLLGRRQRVGNGQGVARHRFQIVEDQQMAFTAQLLRQQRRLHLGLHSLEKGKVTGNDRPCRHIAIKQLTSNGVEQLRQGVGALIIAKTALASDCHLGFGNNAHIAPV